MRVMRDEIVQFLNDYLQVEKFKDYGPNGMQVIGRPEVERVALGVSANLECFRIEGKRLVQWVLLRNVRPYTTL